jgi:hypothetical protein
MKNYMILAVMAIVILTFGCQKEPRNLVDKPVTETPKPEDTTKKPVVIKPWDINNSGFEFLEKIQGHWVGKNRVIADDYDWFAWDYRPISSSHVHGMFEGGSMGNLFNSFYVTDFKNTRTLMVRNGGVLNGIYRTSYFVLDSVNATNGHYYRFIDANGGIDVMSMELRFVNDSLYFNAYTSGLGRLPASRHMTYKAKLETRAWANSAAQKHGYPKNEPAWDFSDGFNQDWLNGDSEPKSATYLSQGSSNDDLLALAQASGDPWTIANYPEMGWLTIKYNVPAQHNDKTRLMFLSEKPLVDASGYLSPIADFNRIQRFPTFELKENSFQFTYAFPGQSYATVFVDVNGDLAPSTGDICQVSSQYTLAPLGQLTVDLNSTWVTVK